MTIIGLLLVLAVLGLIAFGVIQLVPVYLENMKIVQILNQTKDQLDGQSPSVKDIRDALYKRAKIEDLQDIDTKKDFWLSRNPVAIQLKSSTNDGSPMSRIFHCWRNSTIR